MSTYHYGFGPEDERLEDPIVDKVQGNKGLRQLGLRRAKQSHNDSIKTGCQCGFRVGQSYVASNIALIHYYYMEHVDNIRNFCHGQCSTQFKGMRLQIAPHLGKAMKEWIMDNIRLGYSTT
jgi:hypothetical protein